MLDLTKAKNLKCDNCGDVIHSIHDIHTCHFKNQPKETKTFCQTCWELLTYDTETETNIIKRTANSKEE